MKKTVGLTSSYTEHYKTVLKTLWYSAGRPDGMKAFQDIVPNDEYGRKPDYHTIATWRDDQMWDAWADALDAESDTIVDDVLINQRLVMLKEQAARGHELQMKGMEHLRTSGFDTSASAVSAIKLGVDVERTSRGISDRLVKLTKLSDEELTDETQKLLDRALESGEIIDVADVEDIEKEEESEDAEI